MQPTDKKIEISIDADPESKTVILTLVTDDRTLVSGLSMQEAQLLASLLNEAVTAILFEDLASQPERTH